MPYLLFLICFLLACTPEVAELAPEPEVESVAVASSSPGSGAEVPAEVAAAETAGPETVNILAEGEHPELRLDTQTLPFSAYYRVSLNLYKQGETEAIFSTDFFPAEQPKPFLIPSEGLKKGDAYSLQIAGRYPENDCLTDWRLLLVSEPGAGLPGSGNTVYRPVEVASSLLSKDDFQRDAADLNCNFIYGQQGFVKDASGNALKDVVVQAEVRQRDGELAYLNQQLSDQNGRFYFKDLPVGVFTWLVVKQAGFISVERTFSSQFNANGELQQRAQLDIILEKATS